MRTTLGTEKRNSLILIGIHAAVFLYLYTSYQNSCMYYGREWNFHAWLVYSVGDRYVLILLNGLSVLFLCIRRLSRIFANPYVRIRNGCIGRMYMRTVAAFAATVLVYILAEFGISLVVGVCGGLEIPVHEFAKSRALLSLAANLYLYLMTVGMVVLTAYLVLGKELTAGLVTLAFLLPNLAASSSVHMGRAGKYVFWIGRVMPGTRNEWNINLLYWFIWLAMSMLLSGLVMSGEWKKIGRLRGDGTFAATAVVVFLLYGLLAPKMQLSDYFAGFTGIDFYLIRYLFYTIPVLMYLFYQSVLRFSAFGLHVAFRGGSIWKLLRRIVLKCAFLNLLYYAVGILILSIVNVELLDGLTGFLLPLCNIWLENMILVFLAFFIWMWGDENCYGVFGVLFLHLILSVIRSKSISGGSDCIPLTQGIYCLNENAQAEAMVYQIVVLLLLVVFARFTVKRRQDEILIQKFKW